MGRRREKVRRIRRIAVVAGIVLACAAWAGHRRSRPWSGLVLMAWGDVPTQAMDWLQNDLAAWQGVPVRRLAARPLPVDAWIVERGQVDGGRLLDDAEAVALQPGERLLTVCDADGAHRDMTFIIGLGENGGRRAVVFLPRLRKGVEPARYRRRMLLVGRHELGHVAGLPHCDDPHCVMWFSRVVLELDETSPEFCAGCRRRLAWLRRPAE